MYHSPDMSSSRQVITPLSDEIGGVGIIFVEGIVNKRQSVLTLLENGPAMKDGTIRVGDIIHSVNGQSVAGMTMEQVRSLIVGPVGSLCSLSFDRPSTNLHYTVTLVRESNKQREENQALEQQRLQIAEEKLLQMESIKRKLETEVERLTRQVADSRSNFNQQLHTMRLELQTEIESRKALERDLLQCQQGSVDPTELLRLKQENQNLTVDLENASARIRQLELSRRDAIRDESEETFRALRSRLQSALDESRNEARLRLDAESDIKQLQRKIQSITEQKTQQERSHIEIQAKTLSERDNLERERDAAKREINELKHRLQSTCSTLDSERAKSDRLDSDLRRISTEIDVARNEHQRMLTQLRSETDRFLHEKSAILNDRNNLDRRLQDATEEVASMRMTMDRDKADLTHLRDALNQAVMDNSQLKALVEEANRQLEMKQMRILELEKLVASLNEKIVVLQGTVTVADAAKKRFEAELNVAVDDNKKIQKQLELTAAERDTLASHGQQVVERLQLNHKKQVFDLCKSYEEGMQSVVKTSIDRASAMDLELKSAIAELDVRSQQDKRAAAQIGDIFRGIRTVQSEIQEADTDLSSLMQRYRGRQVPLPYGLHKSFDGASSSSAYLRFAKPLPPPAAATRDKVFHLQRGLMA